MTPLKYPRGSEWRRWDLQIHTPHSALNNGFGNDEERYAKAVFQRAVELEVAVIGVTDYFSIEGYKLLRTLQRDPRRLEQLLGVQVATAAARVLLLPNIEFRLSIIVRRAAGKDSRVNFHVLFSDEIDPEVIEDHFLRELKFTAESSPDNPDDRWSVTRANLADLGKRLKEQHENFRDRSDLHIGMMNAVVHHEDVSKLLNDQSSRFRDRYLVVVPADEDLSECSWDGQGHLSRKLVIQKAHMLFSSNRGTRDFGLGKRHADRAAFVKEFGSLKACVHGSDAHTYDSLFRATDGRCFWIKANPTFDGLRQLLHEPESRCHFGDSPPGRRRVEENATKYMDQLSFERTDSSSPEETWFSGSVPLNHGLIAIIGNKGSGKSALADILALLGHTRNSAHFSFLTKDRFLAPKKPLGPLFL
jgi:hypothetical protein